MATSQELLKIAKFGSRVFAIFIWEVFVCVCVCEKRKKNELIMPCFLLRTDLIVSTAKDSSV